MMITKPSRRRESIGETTIGRVPPVPVPLTAGLMFVRLTHSASGASGRSSVENGDWIAGESATVGGGLTGGVTANGRLVQNAINSHTRRHRVRNRGPLLTTPHHS